GRLAIRDTDIDPASNAGAAYVAEGQYVHRQDAEDGRGAANASYRRVTVGGSPAAGLKLVLPGETVQSEPALNARKKVKPDVVLKDVNVAGDGKMVLGIRVTPAGAGAFHTEIALQNLTSNRCANSLEVSVPSGTSISNPGFHGVSYLQEDYSNADWGSN